MNLFLSTPTQLGQILTTARRAAGMTQQEAAPRVGVSQSRLSSMESHPDSITVSQLLSLLALYDLEVIVQGKSASGDTAAEW
jgi:HTH-type transcriptional regulator / antitoxin HipB